MLNPSLTTSPDELFFGTAAREANGNIPSGFTQEKPGSLRDGLSLVQFSAPLRLCGEKILGSWLPDMDLNHDKQIQSLLCYRYTIGQ